jgi:hypothetical protein
LIAAEVGHERTEFGPLVTKFVGSGDRRPTHGTARHCGRVLSRTRPTVGAMNTAPLQITFDCADCHGLARFWAATLGYELEDHHDLVQQMLDTGQATTDDVVERDGRLAWREAAACRGADGTRLLFLVVPEPKTAKNRMHLDVHVPDGTRAAEVQRLMEMGATFLHDGQQGPFTWVTLADPEGNEFCVA